VVALVVMGGTVAIVQGGPVLAPFLIGVAAFAMTGALVDMAERIQLFRQPFGLSLRRLAGLPRSAIGTSIAHFGLGVCLLGIASEAYYGAERILSMKPGQSVEVRGYDLTFDNLLSRAGPNYSELVAKFTVKSGGDTLGVLEPSKRTFTARKSSTTEAALMTRGFSQIYLSLGDAGDDGSIAVRLYHKPLVLLIWLGTVVMVIGGVFSLSDRRLRVGAPRSAKKPKPKLQPAE
jgi:cytochrome c-type biogenesis protein CcmF